MNALPDRPPLKEIGKRTAEAGAGLVAAAHAVALKNFNVDQAAYRGRVKDSHRFGMTTAGMKEEQMAPSTSEDEDENMGDIIVTGDVYGNRAIEALQGQPPSTGPRSLGILSKLIVAASLLAGGAGAGVLVNEFLSSDPPAAVDTDTATDVMFPD